MTFTASDPPTLPPRFLQPAIVVERGADGIVARDEPLLGAPQAGRGDELHRPRELARVRDRADAPLEVLGGRQVRRTRNRDDDRVVEIPDAEQKRATGLH